MRRAGPYLLLAVSLIFVAAGVGMVATGADGGWPALLFFGTCAGVSIGQLRPDLLRPSRPSPSDLLAEFPGPVDLAMDRRRTALLAVGAAVLGGVPAWILLHDPMTGWRAALLWLCAGLICLTVPVLVFLAVKGGSLRLTGEGFELRSGWSRRFTPWEVAGEFAVASTRATRTEMVVYSDARATGRLAGANVALTGRNSALADAYGLSPTELAQVMNAWRERALSGR